MFHLLLKVAGLMPRKLVWLLYLLTAAQVATGQQQSSELRTIPLWNGNVPGIVAAKGQERDTTDAEGRMVAGKPVVRLGDVSEPMLTVYPADEQKNTGAAVMVCPGGGYNILAYDLEGSEVCEWLNSIGVTGILLKYRVPRPAGEGRADGPPVGPLMDAQRALSIVREHAQEWGIRSDRIGVLGFSAGGNLAARLATNFETRAYDLLEEVDQVSCRPDFAVLVYPAYLFEEKDELIAPNLPISDRTPPMFLTMAFDDRVGPENILRMGIALKRQEIPAEVHLYPTGGHGYGLRPSEHQATTWPERCEAWMRANGWLD